MTLQIVEIRKGMPKIVSQEIRHRVIRPHDEVQHVRGKQRHLLGLPLHDDLRQYGTSEIIARLAIANLNRFASLDHVFDLLQRHVLTRVSSVIPAVRVALDLNRVSRHSVNSKGALIAVL